MKFYDLHVQTAENSLEEFVKFAKQLGYSGIAVCNEDIEIDKIKKEISKIKDLEVYSGVTIRAENVEDMRKKIDKVREKVEIVIVRGGNYSINRAACENPKVDMLAHPELERIDIGLDEACLKQAAENNVALQVNFREILYSYRKPRSYIFNHIATNLKVAEKYNVPIVICSGAQNIWDLRPPRELVSLLNILGLDLGKAFSSVTSIPLDIIQNNLKILKGKKITKGVEVV